MAQESANEEGKSSAGDKHETGRAMAQLESEKAAKQLQEAMDLLAILKRIDPEAVHQSAGLGSLVTTDQGNFYLSVAVGKVEVEGFNCFAISVNSPIGAKLLGLKVDGTTEFNGKVYKVLAVS